MFRTIIERAIEAIAKDSEIPRVRRDVLDTIKRKWSTSLETDPSDRSGNNKSHMNSDPTKVDRSKYLALLNPDQSVPPSPEPAIASEEDEFADEFGDAEFVHATEAGRKIADSVAKSSGLAMAESSNDVNKPRAKRDAGLTIVNAEPLPDSLADPEYDAILEPSDCDVRIFGQTEICESVEGPRRSDSRWMVTVLNGFVKRKGSKEEILFRTANQTLTHLYQV